MLENYLDQLKKTLHEGWRHFFDALLQISARCSSTCCARPIVKKPRMFCSSVSMPRAYRIRSSVSDCSALRRRSGLTSSGCVTSFWRLVQNFRMFP